MSLRLMRGINGDALKSLWAGLALARMSCSICAICALLNEKALAR
jgi:hypothetical protein